MHIAITCIGKKEPPPSHRSRFPIQRHSRPFPHRASSGASTANFSCKRYKKIDGVWKFAGLCPDIRWTEGEFDKVFESGREELGEKAEKAK